MDWLFDLSSLSLAALVTAKLDHLRPDQYGWRVLPLEGEFDIDYRDAFGRRSRRHIHSVELKIGPGRTLLGGYDALRENYRGFRADRIERICDTDTGEAIERDVVDWLFRRATRKTRQR